MKLRIKRFLKYTIILIALLIITYIVLLNTPSNKPQTTLSESIPIVYDRPVEKPATKVSVVKQLPNYPSGDEFAAGVSFLRAYGFDLTIEDLINNMNYSDNDFVYCYIGDATTSRGYCYSPALVVCMNNYLAKNSSYNLFTQNFSNISYQELANFITSGNPIVVWITNDYKSPRFTAEKYNDHFTLYENSHVVVVYGIENGIVAFADSLSGEKEGMAEDEFVRLWTTCGSQAIGMYYVN